jgi:hypothetical protein
MQQYIISYLGGYKPAKKSEGKAIYRISAVAQHAWGCRDKGYGAL